MITLGISIAVLSFLLCINLYFYRKRWLLIKSERPRYKNDFNILRKDFRIQRTGPLPDIPSDQDDLTPYLYKTINPITDTINKEKANYDNEEHVKGLRIQFKNQPEILFLNAICISQLRRVNPPKEFIKLYFRIWEDHTDYMLKMLDSRWLLSSLITFEFVSKNEAQKRTAIAANIFFSTIRIYESERMASGFDPTKPVRRSFKSSIITMNFPRIAMLKGDADSNLFKSMVRLTDQDPTTGKMLDELLRRLNTSSDNIFWRIGLIRKRTKIK